MMFCQQRWGLLKSKCIFSKILAKEKKWLINYNTKKCKCFLDCTVYVRCVNLNSCKMSPKCLIYTNHWFTQTSCWLWARDWSFYFLASLLGPDSLISVELMLNVTKKQQQQQQKNKNKQKKNTKFYLIITSLNRSEKMIIQPKGATTHQRGEEKQNSILFQD